MVMNQVTVVLKEDYKSLDQYLIRVKKVFLVAGNSVEKMMIGEYFCLLEKRLGIEVVRFKDFEPNPTYESVVKAVDLFRNEGCDSIVAIGGGSAIDVAKCVKLFSNMENTSNYLSQSIIPNNIVFMAIPTTAGTGSEATRYSVIYYKGEKQSITDNSCIPSIVVFDSAALKTLPEYHRKVSMMDALCHAIESFWSVNSTEESKVYSREAIRMIFQYKDSYLANEEVGNIGMLKAANIAGKAINITQTTAGHAFSYKLTGLYGIAHGHAVALCLSKIFPYMSNHLEKCIDVRGKNYLLKVLEEISEAMNCITIEEAIEKFDKLIEELSLNIPDVKDSDYDILKNSVNAERLKNHPIEIDLKGIDVLYHEILKKR